MFDRPATVSTGITSYSGNINSGTAIGSPQTFAPDVTGEIVNEGRHMEKALIALHEEIDLLAGKLALVLKPSAPNGLDGVSTPAPMRSGIADGLVEANRRIYSANSRLAELRSRVDL